MMLAIGRLIGCESEAEKLCAEFWEGIESAAASCRFETKPRVYFEEWDEPLISGIQWVHELIEKLGGENVFKEKNSPFSGERKVASEEVIRANPEIILASWCGKKVQVEKIASRPGWDSIEAVKKGHIYEIKSSDILAPGPSLVHGAKKMAEIFKKVTESQRQQVIN
jgi:iron complex transport system substrate-binding protein